ncbi:MAG: SDR family oxidoreductase [Nitrospirae bacterium]|nr:SDR family oxidoreductase [Nitrospirota bacterium]
MSKVIVTGGAGFIGSHIVNRYINEGHEVIVIDDLSTGKKENINPRARFHHIDIRDKGMEAIFEKEMPEIVNHHAAQMDVRRSTENPAFDADINIIGTINLLENSVKYGVKRFIFASSGGAIYGEQKDFPAGEEHQQFPLSPYGVSKLAGEKYIHYYSKNFGLRYISLRYSNVYGPRQNPEGEAGVVAIFIGRLLKGKEPVINGDGEQTRDYVYVDDVVHANVRATIGDSDGFLNIGTGIETSVNTLLKKLIEVTGTDIKGIHGPPKKGEQRRSVIDCGRAKRLLGWEPEISLEQGLSKTVDYFRTLAL